ncbi:MAG: hypothetical protein ACLQFF_02310 [Steroidobacteraceae bacterium]|jgi:hypothetical protein
MLLLSAIDRLHVIRLLAGYGLDLRLVTSAEPIPGSYWGESEAGLQGNDLFARFDTPLHSVLHEAAHFICMSPERRVVLDRDAGGDDAEEGAVCYLQILMADALTGVAREQIYADMDRWGYSFRLGAAKAWFEQDAADARSWLLERGLIDERARLTGALRG